MKEAKPVVRSNIYSNAQIDEILSRRNRDEVRKKLMREPTTKDLVDAYEDKWLNTQDQLQFQLRNDAATD